MKHNKEKHIELTESTVLSTRYQSSVVLFSSLARPSIFSLSYSYYSCSPRVQNTTRLKYRVAGFPSRPILSFGGEPIRSVHRLGAIGRF
jgi:hypothetical protein